MNKEINLISIDKKLPNYLRVFNVNAISDLTLDQGNLFFIKVIEDFKSGEITLDELSVFGEIIFHQCAKNKPEKSDLFFTSLSAAELNFEVRSKAAYGNIAEHLRDVDEFFEKYKS